MFQRGVLNLISRFTANNVLTPIRNVSISAPLYLNVTKVLFAEPLKKRKKLDPAVVRAKEERKRKKLEKAIKRLERHAKQMKPVAEIDLTLAKQAELEAQKKATPVLTPEQLEERAIKLKEWNKLKTKEYRELARYLRLAMDNQDKSLDELRSQSEEKYQKAIQINPASLPYSFKGPPETPPVPGYEAPDGDYIDITKKFEGET